MSNPFFNQSYSLKGPHRPHIHDTNLTLAAQRARTNDPDYQVYQMYSGLIAAQCVARLPKPGTPIPQTPKRSKLGLVEQQTRTQTHTHTPLSVKQTHMTWGDLSRHTPPLMHMCVHACTCVCVRV